jgi:hypothetical protein
MPESQLALILDTMSRRCRVDASAPIYVFRYRCKLLLKRISPALLHLGGRVRRRNGAVPRLEHIRAGDLTSLRGYLHCEEAQARTPLQTIPVNRTNSWNEQRRDSAGAEALTGYLANASRSCSTQPVYGSCCTSPKGTCPRGGANRTTSGGVEQPVVCDAHITRSEKRAAHPGRSAYLRTQSV